MLEAIKKQFFEARTLMVFSIIKAVGQALGMLAPLVVAKFFVPELFASFHLAKIVLFTFVAFLITSSQTAFVVFANQERGSSGKANKSFTVQCLFLVISLCIFAVVVLLFRKPIMDFAVISYTDLIFVALAFLGFALKTSLCSLFLVIGERIKNALAELIFGAAVIVLIVLFRLFSEITLRAVFTIYFLSAVLSLAAFISRINLKILLPFELEKEKLKGMFNFTKWVFLSTTAICLFNLIDNMVLKKYVSMDDIAVYNFGYQFFRAITVFTAALGIYFLPFLSENIASSEKIREYFYSKRPKILLASIIVLVGSFFLIPLAIKIVYGDKFAGSETIFRILLIAAALFIYNTFYGTFYNALKKNKFIFASFMVQLLVHLLSNILLVPLYGMAGAAIATIIGYLAKTIVFELYFRLKIGKTLTTKSS